MTSPPMLPNRYNNLDAIRLLLASVVVLGHASHHFVFHADVWNYGFAVSAFLGLSGYLVLASREGSANGWHFLWKRFLRIYPLMILVVAAGIYISKDTIGSALGFLFTAGVQRSRVPIGPAWSIAVEEVLYLFLVGIFAVGRKHLIPITWCLLVVSFFLPLLNDILLPRELSFSTARIAILPLSFFWGNLIYLNREKWTWVKDLRWPFFILGVGRMFQPNGFPFPLIALALVAIALVYPKLRIGLLVAAVCTYYVYTDLSVFLYNPVGLDALYMIPGLLGVGLYAKPVFGKLHERVGDMSYGVYMIHDLLFAVAMILGLSGMTGFFFMWIVSYPLAWLSWHLVENPALSFKNMFWKKALVQA
jgi:peptidoglycan/LPS O-acetylase OafA/YrhL